MLSQAANATMGPGTQHRHWAARLFLVAAMTMALVALTATLALAAPPSIGGSSQTGGSIGGGSSSGGSNSGKGTGGTTYAPKQPSISTRSGSGSYLVNGVRVSNGTTVSTSRGSFTCGALSDGRLPIGWSYSFQYDDDKNQMVPGTFSSHCSYAPSPVDTSIACPVGLSGTIDGPIGPNSKSIANESVTTPFGKSSRKDPSLCGQSWSLAVNGLMNELGRYQGRILTTTQQCVKRHYPQGAQPDVLISCGPERTAVSEFKGAVWCDGYSTTGWPAGHTYTMSECLTKSGSPWACTPGANPTYDGVALPARGNLNILDDGKMRPATWAAMGYGPKVHNVRDVRTRYTYEEGTPFRDGASLTANTQPFVAQPALGASSAGDVTTLNLNFQDAGLPDKPFTVGRTVSFTADMERESIAITSMDIATGAMTTQSTTTYVTEAGACTAPDLRIDVFRARISN